MDKFIDESHTKRYKMFTNNSPMSSRSHLIIELDISITQAVKTPDAIIQETRTSKVVTIDTAGSENMADSDTGENKVSTSNKINQSLLSAALQIKNIVLNPKWVSSEGILTKMLSKYMKGNCINLNMTCVNP